MPPKKKSKRGDDLSTPKKRGKSSKKQPLPYSDMDGTTDGEEEPSLKTNMSLLTSMNTRMSQYEKRLDERNNSASVHAVYTVPPKPSTSRATVEDGHARHLAADRESLLLQHLEKLMEDSEIYGWRIVRDYHAALIQQTEQGRASWGDGKKKPRLRRRSVELTSS